MKRFIASLIVVSVLCCLLCSACFASEEADAVTSASSNTRFTPVGDEYTAAVADLIARSNNLATAADNAASVEAVDSNLAEVMSVNDDGSVSMSTIHAWKVTEAEDGTLYVTVVMTDGQTIRNLAEEGDRGTILVHGDAYYIMHIQTSDVTVLEYSDEAYEAGLFNEDYSGAEEQRCEYTVTFEIYDLQTSYAYMFD